MRVRRYVTNYHSSGFLTAIGFDTSGKYAKATPSGSGALTACVVEGNAAADSADAAGDGGAADDDTIDGDGIALITGLTVGSAALVAGAFGAVAFHLGRSGGGGLFSKDVEMKSHGGPITTVAVAGSSVNPLQDDASEI